jgi:hypothetical protein
LVHLYFAHKPIPPGFDVEQYTALQDFRKQIHKQGLVGGFTSEDDQARKVYHALEYDICELKKIPEPGGGQRNTGPLDPAPSASLQASSEPPTDSERKRRWPWLTIWKAASSIAAVIGVVVTFSLSRDGASPDDRPSASTASTTTTASTSGPPAPEAPLPSPTTLENFATQLVLDSNRSGRVYTLSRNGGTYQSWTVTSSNAGTVTLTNVETNLCLDSNENGRVYTLPCNDGSFQKWLIEDAGQGGVKLRNLETDLVLDSDANGSVYTKPWLENSNQMWIPASD